MSMNITTLSPSSPRSLQVTTGGQLNGNLAVSGVSNVIGSLTPTTGYGLYVRPALTGNAFQIGIYSSPTFDSTATNWGAAIYAKTSTVAGSYTLNSMMTVALASPTHGTGVTINTQYGVYVYNQGNAQVSGTAYGIFIASQSGAVGGNIGLYNQGTTTLSGTLYCNAPAQFTQNVSIGNQPVYTTVGLNMVVNLSGQGVSGVGADQVCQKIVGVFSNVATSGMGLYFQPTSGTSNNFSTIWAFYIDGPNLGSSPVTNYYGLAVKNQSRTGTTNTYGIYVDAQTGGTTNFGLYVNYTSALTAGPYLPGSAVFNNTATGNGTASLITLSCGGYSNWGVGFGTIFGTWWHAFIASSQIQWGFDGSRLRLASDTGWIAPACVNGFAAYGAPWTPGYRKMPDGRVIMRGLLSGGNTGLIMFTLPAGFRPYSGGSQLFACAHQSGTMRIDVDSSGNVQLQGEIKGGTYTVGGWQSINEISFLAEG